MDKDTWTDEAWKQCGLFAHWFLIFKRYHYERLWESFKRSFSQHFGFEVDIKILVKDKEEVNETEEKDIEVKVADFSDEENNNLTFDNFIKR